MRKKRRSKKAAAGAGKPQARLPLPKKGEKRHGDRTKFDRARERERLRRDLDR